MKNRITYKNKAFIQVEVLHKQSKSLTLHEADRIKVSFGGKPKEQTPQPFFIHALEAVDLIQMLSSAVGEMIEKDLPLASRD